MIVAFGVILITCMSAFAEEPAQELTAEKEKKTAPPRLYPYVTDGNRENTRLLALLEYETCPPLRPERFRRKVKMLYGTDIKDYPEDALIHFDPENWDFKLSLKHQIFMDWDLPGEFPFLIPLHQYEEFLPLRKYLFYQDREALAELEKITVDSYEEAAGALVPENIDYDIMYLADILRIAYSTIVFQTPPLLMEYIDKHKHYYSGLFMLSCQRMDADHIWSRTSDLRLDMLSLYLAKELAGGREITSDGNEIDDPNSDKLWLGIHIDRESNGEISSVFIDQIICYFYDMDEFPPCPWQTYKRERGLASFLAFLVQLQHRIQNKTVIQFMSGKLNLVGNSFGKEATRDSLRTNNYYGYAILREFCENPMREMPTLEKIRTAFKGTVRGKSALLYLEPFADSYDIDTIQPMETFNACEMGHDDYYLVEVVKPVESPIAGPDGYALILDRTETVYGYLKKSEVREYTDADTLQTATATKSKSGRINDPDGYVNIRKEMNAQSEILGKILKKEVFDYWEIPGSNWWAVKTRSGTVGFVYKDRIKEHLNTGGWVILDED